MDNKVTSKRINDHLEYDWYKYLIILLVGIVLFYFVFSQINKTRDYEDVAFFVSCYGSSDNRFAERARSDMKGASYNADKYGEALLREISIEEQDPLGKNYGTLYQTHGTVSSDVLIIGDSYLEGTGAGFVEITDELLENYLLPDGMSIDDLEYYYFESSNGEKYRSGIKVSSFEYLPFVTDWRKVESYKDTYGEAAEEEQPDDEFYLVINPSSVNIGKFRKKGKVKKARNMQALYLINRFISYYRYVPGLNR